MPDQMFDVIILGNGITALSAACLFSAESFEVALISCATKASGDEQTDNERSYTIVEPSRNLLNYIGVWQSIEDSKIGNFKKIEVWDSSSEGFLSFDCPVGYEGPMGWVVPESFLKKVLNTC